MSTWKEIVEQFGITLIPHSERMPWGKPLCTQMLDRFKQIYETRGEGHLVEVCRVFAETSGNNALALRQHVVGAVSDAIRARGGLSLALLDKFERVDLLAIEAAALKLNRQAKRHAVYVFLEHALTEMDSAPAISLLDQSEEVAAKIAAEVDRRGIKRGNRYSGVGIASKALGIAEEDALAALDIAGLSEAAKTAAVLHRRHNDRRTLLTAAKASTPEGQVEVIEAAAERHQGRKGGALPRALDMLLA